MDDRSLVLTREITYWTVLDLWAHFHWVCTRLLVCAEREFLHLFSGDIESLERDLIEKNRLLALMDHLEHRRKQALRSILAENLIVHSEDLVTFMREISLERRQRPLEKLNVALKSVAVQLKDQHKKNRPLIRRALFSLASICGHTAPLTYDASGGPVFVEGHRGG